MKKRIGIIALAIFAIAAVTPGIAFGEARTFTWIGGSGNWSETTNWDPAELPGPEDTVAIPSTAVVRTITVDVPASIHTLNWTQTQGQNLNKIVLEQDLTCVTALLPGNISGPWSWHSATHPMTVSEGTTFSQVDGDHIDFYGIVFSGTGSVVKNGTTTWGLRQYDLTLPFAGTWIVNDGILLFGRGGSCQNSARVIVNAGGTMTSAGYGDQTPQAYTLNGTGFPVDVGGGVMVGQGALRFTEDTTTSRPITLATDSDIAVDASRTGTLTGQMYGPGNLNKTGPGTLLISGTSKTYEGTITVAAGKLKVTTSVACSVIVKANAVLEGAPVLFPKNEFNEPDVVVEEGGTWNYGPNVWWGNGSPTSSGVWSDPDNWTHGVVPGVGDNVGSDAAIGSTAVSRTINVDVPVTLGTLTWHQTDGDNLNNIVLEEDLICVTALLPGNLAGIYSWLIGPQKMTVSEGTTFSQVDGDHLDPQGIAFSGTGSVVKNGTTTWSLRSSSFPGTWIVNDGILSIGRGSGQNSAGVIVNAGGTMTSAGYGNEGPQAYTLNGTGYKGQGALRFTQDTTTSRPITLATDSDIAVDASRTGTLTGAIDGAGNLRKIGLGTLIIAGSPKTYGGTIDVAAGKLKVLTPITSPVVVRAGAILEGPPIYFPGGVAGVTVEPGGTWNYGPNAWWGNGDPTAGGNWSDPDNWTHMVVPGVGATVGEDATIGSTTVKRTITVDVPVTIGTLEWHQIDGANLNYIVLEQDLTCVTALLPGNISGPYSWHNATHPMTVSEGTSFSQVDGDHIDFYGIVFSGTGSVVKNGTTTWGLRQYGVTQPFAGTWIVNDGILLFGRGGSCQNSARVIVKAGGSMMSAGYGDQTPQAYTLNGTGHQDQGALRFTASDASSRPITVETDALLTVDSGFTATVTGAIDGDGILTKGGLGKLAISACTTDVSVAAGTLGLETSTALAETSSLSIATGATIDVADDANVVVAALYIDDVLQFSGTYGPTGSGAANINDTLFTGRLGMITAGSPGPAITAFVVSDASTGSTLVTNDATVNVTLTAEAGGASITGYAITQEDVQPTEGWSETAPATCTITGGEGTITLYAWVKDSAEVVGKASASILFTTAVPVVSNVAVAGPEGTATVTWDTDIDTVGSVKYGQVSQTGGTTAEVAETALGKAHSVTITGLEAGKNYKLVIVNNEILASPPVYWPSPWPIAGDANHDCRVNILDLIFIRNKLNQAVGTGDNWKADVNQDTRINILDLIYVRNKLNTQCP